MSSQGALQRLGSITALLIVLQLGQATWVSAATMVELQYEGNTHTGTVIAHDATHATLMERDGRIVQVEMARVGDYRKVGTFKPFSAVELREKLAREFGPGFEVTSTSHYLVVQPRGSEQRYPTLFENLYRDFFVSFRARGFRVHEPEFPLVAIVFPTAEQFSRYCRAEDVAPQTGLRGYYLPSSNRVALYDSATAGDATEEMLDRTVIHEAVHQVAFNVGIHSRLGSHPKWLVEGLATAFEVEQVRRNDRSASSLERVNPERFAWWTQRALNGGKPRIGMLIAEDERFQEAVLDAYCDSWALTFFLLETRPSEYSKYLKTLADRDPGLPYTPEERLHDFQKAFGRDPALLEARMSRFYDDLSATREIAEP